MEFKAIVDVKAREAADCAVVGIYEQGDLGAGEAAARVLLIRLGAKSTFARKQFRKALQTAATSLSKTGAIHAVVYLTLEDVADLDVPYRARMVAEVFSVQAYKVPDLKTSPKPKPPKLATIS